MIRLGAPLFAPILFGVFGVLIMILGVDWMLGRSVVRADRASLTIRRTWLGLGGTRTIQPRDVTAMAAQLPGAGGKRSGGEAL